MRVRGSRQVVLFAALLACGMLLAAHVPLHDFEAMGERHDDHGQELDDHQHPVRASAVSVFSIDRSVAAFVAPIVIPALPRSASCAHASSSPIRCDDDIGLHDLLSVYQI